MYNEGLWSRVPRSAPIFQSKGIIIVTKIYSVFGSHSESPVSAYLQRKVQKAVGMLQSAVSRLRQQGGLSALGGGPGFARLRFWGTSFHSVCRAREFLEAGDGRVLGFFPFRKSVRSAEFSSVVLFTPSWPVCADSVLT